jgi:hypothetical protein
METNMTDFATSPAAMSAAAASTTVKPQSERSSAQTAVVRYAEEIASLLARGSRNAWRDEWRDGSRNDRGAFDSPLFANV